MNNTMPVDNKNGNAIEPDISDRNVQAIPHYSDGVPRPSAERTELEGLDDNHPWSNVPVEDTLPRADSGWRWPLIVIVSAIFVLNWAHGLRFSTSLMYHKVSDYFHSSLSKVFMIENLAMVASLFPGPITGALVDHYGCKIMTVFAGILATCSLLLAAISNSVEMLYLTLGLLKGLAVGIMYVTAIVSVVFWFEKRRNLAVSLVFSGISFGSFIYSPMTNGFLESYDWKNTILFLSGISLIVCVFGMLLRNPNWLEIKRKRERELSKTNGGPILLRTENGEDASLDVEELMALLQSGKSSEYILAAITSSIEESAEWGANTRTNVEQTNRRMPSAIRSYTFEQQKIPAEVIAKLMENKQLYDIIMHKYPELISRADTTWSHHLGQRKKSTIDVKILMFNVSYLIFTTWSLIPFYFLRSYMSSRDMEGEDTMFNIMNISVGIGTILLGWVGDHPWINVTKTYASCLIICGLSVAAIPLFVTRYWALAVVSAIFGLSFASSNSFTPAMLLKLTPIDHFPTTYGFLLLIKGIAYMLGQIVFAWLYPLIGGWGLCFCISGLCVVVSGICMGGIAFMKDQRTHGSAPLHYPSAPLNYPRSPRPVEV